MSEKIKEIVEVFMTRGTMEKLDNGRFMRNKGPARIDIIVQKTKGNQKLHPETFKPNILARFTSKMLIVYSIKQKGKKTLYSFNDSQERERIVDFDVIEALRKHPDYKKKYIEKEFVIEEPKIIEYENDAPVVLQAPTEK